MGQRLPGGWGWTHSGATPNQPPNNRPENIKGPDPIAHLVKSITLLPHSLPELTFIYCFRETGCAQVVDQETGIRRGAMTSQGVRFKR